MAGNSRWIAILKHDLHGDYRFVAEFAGTQPGEFLRVRLLVDRYDKG